MRVDGQCPGDKRKLQHISDDGQGSDIESCMGDEKSMALDPSILFVTSLYAAVSVAWVPSVPTVAVADKFDRDPRDTVRISMLAQKEVQAKAIRERAQRRSTPYAK